MNKNNFILYKDYAEHVNLLTDEQAGKLFKAIFMYVDGRNEVDLDPITKMAFSFIKANLERDLKKYKNIVERNKLNGSKGGRPKKEENPNNPSGLSDNPKEPKKADIGIDIDIDTDIDNDKDNDIVKERHLEYVLLTDDEFDKLVDRFGNNQTNDLIERLNNYIGSKGKKYKSHYHTILNWAKKEGLDKTKKSEYVLECERLGIEP